MNKLTFSSLQLGVIILGGGIIKYHILNSCTVRGGADFAVYINSA